MHGYSLVIALVALINVQVVTYFVGVYAGYRRAEFEAQKDD